MSDQDIAEVIPILWITYNRWLRVWGFLALSIGVGVVTGAGLAGVHLLSLAGEGHHEDDDDGDYKRHILAVKSPQKLIIFCYQVSDKNYCGLHFISFNLPSSGNYSSSHYNHCETVYTIPDPMHKIPDPVY